MTRRIARRSLLRTGLAAAAGALAAPALAQGRATINVGNASGTLTLTMQEMMKQLGYFEQFGVEATVLNVADGGRLVGGIIGGDLDVSVMSGFGQIFPAIERGGRLKVLGGAAVLPSLAVFTSKPDVRTLKDLEGRIVGTGALGTLLHQLMVALLRKHNVDVAKVTFANIGSSVDVLRSVAVGTVDAGPGDVSVIEMADTFKVRPVANGNLSIELPEYTYQGAWAADRAIATKRDAIVRLMAAQAKLYRFVHTPEAKDAFLKARAVVAGNANPAEAAALWNYVQAYKPYAVNLAVSEERLRYMQQLNVDTGVQTRVLPFEQVADMSLARDAVGLLA